jgi:hypothetical protein
MLPEGIRNQESGIRAGLGARNQGEGLRPDAASEGKVQSDAHRSGECRMRVDVVEALGRFAREPRRVEIVDVGDLCVEQIEDFSDDARAGGHA